MLILGECKTTLDQHKSKMKILRMFNHSNSHLDRSEISKNKKFCKLLAMLKMAQSTGPSKILIKLIRKILWFSKRLKISGHIWIIECKTMFRPSSKSLKKILQQIKKKWQTRFQLSLKTIKPNKLNWPHKTLSFNNKSAKLQVYTIKINKQRLAILKIIWNCNKSSRIKSMNTYPFLRIDKSSLLRPILNSELFKTNSQH